MKIATIIGARPQFIKAATLSRCIRDHFSDKIEEILIHTGQHHDDNMSKVFFQELEIPLPQYNLGISGGTHGQMTGRMLETIEKVLLKEKPECVLVYGDTNSTLAGALAASKLHIPIAHVEAGLRSFNKTMPEEINRTLTDKLSTYLLCPTSIAVRNLAQEGIRQGVSLVGDVMYDSALHYQKRLNRSNSVFSKLNIAENGYILATCHRQENTDSPQRLNAIISTLSTISHDIPILFPLHPRTHQRLLEYGLMDYLKNIQILPPLSYFDLLALEQAAKVIVTDSGGMQKEAFFCGVPCVTLRDETEWLETVELGWNQLVGANPQKITLAIHAAQKGETHTFPYGDGHASLRILQSLVAIEKEYV